MQHKGAHTHDDDGSPSVWSRDAKAFPRPGIGGLLLNDRFAHQVRVLPLQSPAVSLQPAALRRPPSVPAAPAAAPAGEQGGVPPAADHHHLAQGSPRSRSHGTVHHHSGHWAGEHPELVGQQSAGRGAERRVSSCHHNHNCQEERFTLKLGKKEYYFVGPK